VNEAYATLSDEKKREEYDKRRNTRGGQQQQQYTQERQQSNSSHRTPPGGGFGQDWRSPPPPPRGGSSQNSGFNFGQSGGGGFNFGGEGRYNNGSYHWDRNTNAGQNGRTPNQQRYSYNNSSSYNNTENARKKEEELLRISEKAKSIDFTTLGVAARSVASKPVEKGATEVSIGDTSDFEEAGSAWVQDDEGGMNISWTGKTATALTGVKGLKRGFAAAATVTASDDLQRIKGVGPFIEDKLNALGIYTFEQVGNMTAEIEEQVNIAIEFFPGRIKRDKWANQARKFAKQK